MRWFNWPVHEGVRGRKLSHAVLRSSINLRKTCSILSLIAGGALFSVYFAFFDPASRVKCWTVQIVVMECVLNKLTGFGLIIDSFKMMRQQ